MNNSEMPQYALLTGANSTIAHEIICALANQEGYDKIVCFSRQSRPDSLNSYPQIDWHAIDYTEDQIAAHIKRLAPYAGHFSKMFICHGKLHDDNISPEKRIEDFSAESFQHTLTANTLTPMLWLKNCLPILKGRMPCKVAVFSARVGSIEDNRLGGWYSYRASKAGLNMMLKTAAIEYARRAKNVKLIAFHPGTVNTPLSKPFQASVKPEKIFTPEFVAQQLLHIMDHEQPDGELAYLDWNHQAIAW